MMWLIKLANISQLNLRACYLWPFVALNNFIAFVLSLTHQ